MVPRFGRLRLPNRGEFKSPSRGEGFREGFRRFTVAKFRDTRINLLIFESMFRNHVAQTLVWPTNLLTN